MKLTLVVPNFRWSNQNPDFLWDYIPYNLCLLGAMVKGKCKVEVVDAYKRNLSLSAFKRKIAETKPDVVGITIMIDQHMEAGLWAAREVKNVSPIITVVLGGASATVNADILYGDSNVDIVIMGEGEALTDDIIMSGNKGFGIWSGRVNELDSLPLPDYSLIHLPSYINTPPTRKSVDSPRAYPYGRILTSRGCPYGCCFCQVSQIMGSRWRGRSVESVLEEIAWLKKDYGVRSLVFDDDNLLYDTLRAKEIFKGMIRRDLAMPWSMIATAVNKIDLPMIKLMKRSGCKYVDVAIESGVPRVLKDIIRKPITLNDAIETVRLVKAHGIFVAANFIIGFPGETWQEIRDTLDFADWFNADYTKVFTATPLTHTRLWDMCVDGGYLVKGDAWRQGQISTPEFSPQELTVLRAYEWDRINFTNPNKRKRIAMMMGISEGELEVIRKNTRRRVYA